MLAVRISEVWNMFMLNCDCEAFFGEMGHVCIPSTL